MSKWLSTLPYLFKDSSQSLSEEFMTLSSLVTVAVMVPVFVGAVVVTVTTVVVEAVVVTALGVVVVTGVEVTCTVLIRVMVRA